MDLSISFCAGLFQITSVISCMSLRLGVFWLELENWRNRDNNRREKTTNDTLNTCTVASLHLYRIPWHFSSANFLSLQHTQTQFEQQHKMLVLLSSHKNWLPEISSTPLTQTVITDGRNVIWSDIIDSTFALLSQTDFDNSPLCQWIKMFQKHGTNADLPTSEICFS